MTWDALGAIAELIGALAVIISIVYLAAQVRNGAADVRANIIHSLHGNEVELMAMPATDTVLGMAVEKAHTNRAMSDEERAQYSMWMYANLVQFQQVFLEYRRLGVDSRVSDASRMRLVGGFESGLARAVWNRLRDRFTDEFQAYADGCVRDAIAKSSARQ